MVTIFYGDNIAQLFKIIDICGYLPVDTRFERDSMFCTKCFSKFKFLPHKPSH
jgi:hypothetical protein